jgi:hypothetical protein
MRLIILPQALKISIPGIVNTFIGLFKDTTLVVFIGLLDPIGLSNAIRATTDWNGIYWELFIFIGACSSSAATHVAIRNTWSASSVRSPLRKGSTMAEAQTNLSEERAIDRSKWPSPTRWPSTSRA